MVLSSLELLHFYYIFTVCNIIYLSRMKPIYFYLYYHKRVFPLTRCLQVIVAIFLISTRGTSYSLSNPFVGSWSGCLTSRKTWAGSESRSWKLFITSSARPLEASPSTSQPGGFHNLVHPNRKQKIEQLGFGHLGAAEFLFRGGNLLLVKGLPATENPNVFAKSQSAKPWKVHVVVWHKWLTH